MIKLTDKSVLLSPRRGGAKTLLVETADYIGNGRMYRKKG
jgi:hypothetical protein